MADTSETDRSKIEAAFAGWPSLPAMFFSRAGRLGRHPLLHARRNGRWIASTWQEVAEDVRRCARGLRSLGVGTGDRVAIISENRPEWLVADFAIMSVGAITVPVYTTATTADQAHVLKDSGVRCAVVSTPVLFRKVLPAILQAPDLATVVTIDPPDAERGTGVDVLGWNALLDRGVDPNDFVEDGVAAIGRDDPCCIIYTSGTGGTPKGALLSHDNLLSNCLAAALLLAEIGIGQDERFLSFLPLSHAYEHTAGQMFPLTIGAEIAYADSMDRLASSIAEMRPTLITAVPRLYEVLRARILREMRNGGGIRAKLFERALALEERRAGGRASRWDAAEDRLLDRLVRSRVRQRFGGRLKAFISGGAPLSPEVARFFDAAGLRILQGYGQTEAAPLISVNPPTGIRHETVGKPVHGTQVRIAEDGEILVRGPQVMLGYWNDPTATERVLAGGWLHTGDIGRMETDGYLVVTDRKKDIIVTTNGENLSPRRIESLLVLEPEISQAIAIGDHKPYVAALIVPDPELAADWASRHDKPDDPALLVEDAEFRRMVATAVERANACLSATERIRRFALLAEPFTIENGLLTPTLKVRRQLVTRTHEALVSSLYRDAAAQSVSG